MKRAVIVEDRATFGPSLGRRLETLGVTARWVPHQTALDLEPAHWQAVDFVFLDALDLATQQGDPTRSRMTSLDLLDLFATLSPSNRPTIIVYSTGMRRPELNIVLREGNVASAFYDLNGLTETLPELILGKYPGQVPVPTTEDFRNLDPDLSTSARVAAAHQRMREHPRAWQQIWDPDASFDRGAQMWIRRNVLPLLQVDAGGYGIAKRVVRRVAGLPWQL